MKHIFHTIQHTARAATVLLLALLTAQMAGAQTNVRDAYGLVAALNDPTVSVINVTDDFTDVGGLSLNRALTINLNGHTISGDGLHFNVGPGLSLTINGEGQGGSVGNIISGNAYGPAINNEGTVTLRNVNITTNFDYAIYGFGTLYIGNNVSFNGWTERPFNTQKFNTEGGNYNYAPGNLFANVVATVTVGGTPHYFENLDAALAYILSQPAHFSVNDAGTEYTIHTANGWDLFCALLEAGETFSGKTVELANDITVTRMAGSAGHEFQGTFDGNKKTLTVSISNSDGNAAPFREIMGATIRNLKVSGTVSGHKHSAGLVSYARGADSSVENTIENCLVATDVSTIVDTDGDCYLGGIVGHGFNCKLTIRGCAFTGSLTSPHNYTGGLQGWSDGNTLILENDIFAASSVNAANVGFHPIAIHANNKTTTATVTNVYYTVAPTCTTASRIAAAGKQARSITAGTDVTVAHAGVATHYATSGITAYKATGASADINPFIAGLLYNNNEVDVLYAGSGDVVSLTLSNTATGAPDGYQYGYTTNAGTLSGSTLTMPDQDVTVSVNTEVLTAIPWSGDGTEGSPYIIKYASQLDLLAHRVNGTHGETRREDGYENKFFQLAKDISYSHKADGEEGADIESNYEAIGGYYNGERYFSGHFDGNNKTISGIRIYKDGDGNADYYQGIFGRTGTVADIHHLTLADARITGHDFTGGIVGYNTGGTVTRCHVAADVAVCAVQYNALYHGGIVGYNNFGDIEQCTSAATLTTADADNSYCYGGIAGYNYGTLSDNLAIGATVPAAKDNTYGAITGYNGGSLQRNYYAACEVANTPNATGVGCGNIDDGNGGYTTADVNNDNNPNGAVSIHTLVLADAADNTTAIATAATACTGGKTLAVQLQGRTLYKDGDWNTLCLPFAMTAEQVTAQLAPAKLMTLSSSAFAGQELTLNFEDATTIEPGKPYIIKWTRPDGYTVDGGFDITNPVFTGVTIPSGYTSSEAITAALATASCSTDYVTFIGTYGPTAIYTDPATNLYLGSGNTLYWPSSTKDINSFRAYFHLNNGLTASTPAGARAFVLNFGDEETTGVVPIDNGQLTIDNSAAAAWYDMQGRKLLAQPTARGIYIHGGKKVVIK